MAYPDFTQTQNVTPSSPYNPSLSNYTFGTNPALNLFPAAGSGGLTINSTPGVSSDFTPVYYGPGTSDIQYGQPSNQTVSTTNTQPAYNPPPSPYVSIPFSEKDFQVPDFNQLVKEAFSDPALVAYYDRLLKENQGDVNLAKQNLSYQYTTGSRYQQEDLATSMKQLGVQFPQETESLVDTLNKRGIALTQGNGGKLNVATEGRAGTEMSRLTEDQKLRQEAVQRTAQRGVEALGFQKKTGEESIAKGQRDYQEQLQQEREQKSLQMAGIKQTQQQMQQQAEFQKKQLEAQNQQAQQYKDWLSSQSTGQTA